MRSAAASDFAGEGRCVEADCEALLLRAFDPNLYAIEYLQSFPIMMGGRKGVRFEAYTRWFDVPR